MNICYYIIVKYNILNIVLSDGDGFVVCTYKTAILSYSTSL